MLWRRKSTRCGMTWGWINRNHIFNFIRFVVLLHTGIIKTCFSHPRYTQTRSAVTHNCVMVHRHTDALSLTHTLIRQRKHDVSFHKLQQTKKMQMGEKPITFPCIVERINTCLHLTRTCSIQDLLDDGRQTQSAVHGCRGDGRQEWYRGGGHWGARRPHVHSNEAVAVTISAQSPWRNVSLHTHCGATVDASWHTKTHTNNII